MLSKIKFIKIFALYLCFISSSFAGELLLYPEKAKFFKGETIILVLELKNDKAYKNPNFDNYAELGLVLTGQAQFIKTSIINGKRLGLQSWKLSFRTAKTGQITLPEITVHTKNGVVTSNKTSILISDKPRKQGNYITDNIKISTKIIGKKPKKNDFYISENFLYQVTVIRYINLYQAEYIEPSSKDVIISALREDKSEEVLINNRKAIRTTYLYKIIPIKQGSFVINPAKLQGKIIDQNSKYKSSSQFEQFFSFSGNKYKNFQLFSPKLKLNIKPAEFNDNKWLVAKKINLKYQNLDIKNKYPGDDISISIKLSGYDLTSSQLPNITFPKSRNYNIYPEKPLLKDKITKHNNIYAEKIFNWTIIPTQAKNIDLSNVSVTWWNSKKNQKETTKLPVLNIKITPLEQEEEITKDNIRQKNVIQKFQKIIPKWIIISIIILIVIIMLLSTFIIRMFFKNKRSTNDEVIKDKISISGIGDIIGLEKFCLKFCQDKFKIEFLNLSQISNFLEKNAKNNKKTIAIKGFFQKIETYIYGKNNDYQITDLKKEMKTVLNDFKFINIKSKKKKKGDFELNP